MIKRLSKMGLIVLVTLLSLALVVLPACTTTPAGEEEEEEEQPQVITIKAATYFGPTTDQCKMLDAFCNDLQTESDGQLSITRYWGGTLAGGPQLYPAAADGSIDIIFTMLGYTGGRFPPMDAFAQPFGIPSAWAGSHVAQDLYNQYHFSCFNDTHPLFFSMSAPLVMYTKTAVRTKADLNGLKIRTGPPNNCIINSLGAKADNRAMSEVYEAIRTGLLDGVMIGCDGFTAWKLADVAKYCTLPYVAGGDVFVVTMSNKCWNSLPADVQQVVTDVSAHYADVVCTMWTDTNKASMAAGPSQGAELITLPAAERTQWQTALAGCMPTWVTTMVGKGYVQSDVEGWLSYVQERLSYWIQKQIQAGVPFLTGYPPAS
jgi:TRAP-type C4-dicarboxylate transport system substrate-binding protein